jgi:hypothetical protein
MRRYCCTSLLYSASRLVPRASESPDLLVGVAGFEPTTSSSRMRIGRVSRCCCVSLRAARPAGRCSRSCRCQWVADFLLTLLTPGRLVGPARRR